MHLLTQILGKYKLATAFQEPQWAHVMLDITTQGITTGLLHYEDKYFEININLLLHKITVIVDDQSKDIPLEDGTAIKDYYKAISTFLNDNGIHPVINTKPQEMDIKTPFEDDEDHHHYQPDKAVEVLKLMHHAHQAESAFINPLRARKIKSVFLGVLLISAVFLYITIMYHSRITQKL